MSDFVKHITDDFEHHDNMVGDYPKHIKKQKTLKDFEESDNFIDGKPKHILNFDKDDNFRGKV